MNWIKIEDPSNLPFGDVLATVDDPTKTDNGKVLVGDLVFSTFHSEVICQCDPHFISGVTHYINLSDIPRP